MTRDALVELREKATEQMVLEHYSSKPISGGLRRCAQPVKEHHSVYDKPVGLWLSVKGEDDWPSWCRSESFNLDGLRFRHRVSLAPAPNVLVLRAPDFYSFERQYGVLMKNASLYRDTYIDWLAVAQHYNGIIIPTYVWPYRLNKPWYYGWDCASGCIWNPEAIASIEVSALIEQEPHHG